jgi:hypothetical protein
MGKKVDLKPNDQKTTPKAPHVTEIKRYTSEKNRKETPKLNETQTGPRKSRGKKQQRQFKLAPNRG